MLNDCCHQSIKFVTFLCHTITRGVQFQHKNVGYMRIYCTNLSPKLKRYFRLESLSDSLGFFPNLSDSLGSFPVVKISWLTSTDTNCSFPVVKISWQTSPDTFFVSCCRNTLTDQSWHNFFVSCVVRLSWRTSPDTNLSLHVNRIDRPILTDTSFHFVVRIPWQTRRPSWHIFFGSCC